MRILLYAPALPGHPQVYCRVIGDVLLEQRYGSVEEVDGSPADSAMSGGPVTSPGGGGPVAMECEESGTGECSEWVHPSSIF